MIDPKFITPDDFWGETQPRRGDSQKALANREAATRFMPAAVFLALGSAASFTALKLEIGNNFVNGVLFFTGLIEAVSSLAALTLATESVSEAHRAEAPGINCQADKLPLIHRDLG